VFFSEDSVLLFLCSCLSLHFNFRVNCLRVVLCCTCPAFLCPAFSRNPFRPQDVSPPVRMLIQLKPDQTPSDFF